MRDRYHDEIEELKKQLQLAQSDSGYSETAQLLQLTQQEKERRHSAENTLARYQDSIAARQRRQDELQQRLKALQQKLVQREALVKTAKKRRRELEEAEHSLQNKQREQEEKSRRLEAQRAAATPLRARHASIEEQVAETRKALQRARETLHVAREERDDLLDETQQQREQLLDIVRELSHQIAFREEVLARFVPRSQLRRLRRRLIPVSEEGSIEWKLKPPKRRNLRARAGPIPIDSHSSLCALLGSTSARWRHENVLTLTPQIPARATRDWQGPLPAHAQ
ncbi:MAG: hypothetical protein MHM6MM_005708 [Cercozoa sp. M6MM]